MCLNVSWPRERVGLAAFVFTSNQGVSQVSELFFLQVYNSLICFHRQSVTMSTVLTYISLFGDNSHTCSVFTLQLCVIGKVGGVCLHKRIDKGISFNNLNIYGSEKDVSAVSIQHGHRQRRHAILLTPLSPQWHQISFTFANKIVLYTLCTDG